MKDNIKEQKKNIKLLILVIGVILLIGSISIIVYDIYLENRAVNTTGRVQAINYVDGKNKATVSLRLTGHEYEAVITLKKNDNYAVDDIIPAKVDMYNPTKEIINNHYYIYAPTIFLATILLIISLPFLIKLYKRKKYCQELKEKGFYINANITEVFINKNEKLKYKGQYPFRLRARYFNPQTNSEYVFESEDTYININDPIAEYHKTTVVVYLNQSDLNNYYVDLDSLYPPLNVIDPIELMGPKTEIKFHFGTKMEEKTENPENSSQNEQK